jgi:hypothetical protein
VKVEVRVEVRRVEPLDRFGVIGTNKSVADMLAHDGAAELAEGAFMQLVQMRPLDWKVRSRTHLRL